LTVELYSALARIAASGDDEGELPETLDNAQRLIDAMPVWKLWRQTDRKILPSAGGLLDQPADLLYSLLELDGLFETVREQRKKDNGRL
jgi:hypothetical protein